MPRIQQTEVNIKEPLNGHCYCGRNTFTVTQGEFPNEPSGEQACTYYDHCSDCRTSPSPT